MNRTNQLKVHSRPLPLPVEWTPTESAEVARALLLCYRDGQFTCQTFFTQPLIGQINWLEGLKPDAQVYFREINAIGIDLFHLRLVGTEEDARKMCREAGFYNVLRGIEATLTQETRSRWYVDTASGGSTGMLSSTCRGRHPSYLHGHSGLRARVLAIQGRKGRAMISESDFRHGSACSTRSTGCGLPAVRRTSARGPWSEWRSAAGVMRPR